MLIAVGLGPGDSELLTVKAVRLLKEADRVFVPGEVAKKIVAPYRDDVIVLSFPMTDDEEYIRQCMEKNAEKIAPPALNGLAVFGILGDPNFYGTFKRLCEILKKKYPEIETRTIPGISSITAFASVADISVSGGFSITDGSDDNAKILLKVREPQKKAEELREEGYTGFVLVERMYMDGEKVYRNNELPEKSAYFSVMFAEK
ncbi:MAG: cobalt-factor II C(20)-methyltransferase [Euryarchaeota archaeon]|nr:cobalt-factor II C(20)-methyltransferase [Euryarchaeota archaeon]